MVTRNGLQEAVILAGGLGTRLRGVNDALPKPMMPVGGRPFLAFLLHLLEKGGVRRAVLSVGYKHEAISTRFGTAFGEMELAYCVEEEPLGTGGALAAALRLTVGEQVAVLNGDSYLGIDLAAFSSFHRERGGQVSMAVKYQENCGRFGAVSMAAGRVVSFREKGSCDSGYINGGFYLMNRDIATYLPRERPFSLETDVLQKHAGALSIHPFVSDGYFIDIGTPDDYRRAQAELPAMAGWSR